nr:hypothetical protein [Tanacetum cinerariifolium]
MFTDEQPPDYSFPPRFDVYPDNFLEIEFDVTFNDNSFDSEGEKIKEAELLIDPLDLPCDILSEYDSFNSQDFSRDDVLFSPDNEDKDFDPPFSELLVFKEVLISMRLLLFSSENEEKVFKPGIYTFKKFHCCFLSDLSHPGILSHEKSVKIITRVTQEKKLAVFFASWLFENFNPPFSELLVFKEVPNSMRLLLFSSENEKKVFKPGIYTFKKFHCCFLSELSHPGFPIASSLMKIFHVQNGKNTPPLDVLLFHFYPP